MHRDPASAQARNCYARWPATNLITMLQPVIHANPASAFGYHGNDYSSTGPFECLEGYVLNHAASSTTLFPGLSGSITMMLPPL